MKTFTYILFQFLITSCRDSEKVPQDTIVSQYVITSYYNNSDDPKNFASAKYYDSSNKLIREIGGDGDCTRYIYDETDKLIETIWGRTCEYGVRQILIFDTLGNHIGYYRPLDSIFDIDTIQFDQIKFYDSQNRLVEEKVDERKNVHGEKIFTRNYYTYEGENKSSVEIKENDITIWKGTYQYDTKGRLVELKKVRKSVFEIDYYVYDDSDRLIEKGTKSNVKTITPLGTFDYPEKKRVFQYDSTGFLNKEIVYHDNKILVKVINIKTYNED